MVYGDTTIHKPSITVQYLEMQQINRSYSAESCVIMQKSVRQYRWIQPSVTGHSPLLMFRCVMDANIMLL